MRLELIKQKEYLKEMKKPKEDLEIEGLHVPWVLYLTQQLHLIFLRP